MARTAVVAGTATAVSNSVNRRMNPAPEPVQPQQQYEAPQSHDLTAQLQKLTELKAQGALSDAEFQAAKQKLMQ
jgi:hypothetical protein